ncbi:hypothetical protein CSC28_7146 (plasmid) [Pseudomonas paraeruginosa]|nr:hypothetical protein CSC28_7146 [Pseudomonas paraeruginosa]
MANRLSGRRSSCHRVGPSVEGHAVEIQADHGHADQPSQHCFEWLSHRSHVQK